MDLGGDLKSMPLSDLLQSLKANQQKGVLSFTRAKKEFHLFFDSVTITCVNPGGTTQTYLPSIIATHLDCPEERILQQVQKRSTSSIADKLHKARIADKNLVHHLHRIYLTEALYDLFAWKQGTFAFHSGEAPDDRFDTDQQQAEVSIEIDVLVFEAMRRQDEWRMIRKHISSVDDVFVYNVERTFVPPESELERQAYELCNGENSVRKIAYKLGADLFSTACAVNVLILKKIIRHVEAEDLFCLAKNQIDAKNFTDAVSLLKRAVELDRADTEARILLAETYGQIDETENATKEYKVLAQLAREKDEFEEARGFYEKIIALNPSEFEFQKRLYDMLRETGHEDTLKTGLMLAETLEKLGVHTERQKLLKEMTADFPLAIHIHELLGDTEMALGNNEQAIDLYISTAEIALKQNNIKEALRIYKKVQKLDPGSARIQERIHELETGLYQQKKENYAKLRKRLTVLCSLSLVIAYLAYESFVLVSYLNMRQQNLIYLSSSDFEKINENIAQFRSRFVFTIFHYDLPRYTLQMDSIYLKSLETSVQEKEPVQEVVNDSLSEDTPGTMSGDSLIE